jgi:hypothetical protein
MDRVETYLVDQLLHGHDLARLACRILYASLGGVPSEQRNIIEQRNW